MKKLLVLFVLFACVKVQAASTITLPGGGSIVTGGGTATNVTAASILDATATGIALMTATDAAAGRAALNVGTAGTNAAAAFEAANSGKYQATNGVLTAVVAGTMTSALSNTVSFGAPVVYAGNTNIAAKLAALESAGGTTATISANGTAGVSNLVNSVSVTVNKTNGVAGFNLVAIPAISGAALLSLNGSEVTSGTVDESVISSLIARDTEVTAAIAAATNYAAIYATNMTAETFMVGATNVAGALAAKQPLDTDLTALAGGTAMATLITNAVSVGAPILIAGTTNVAAKLASLDSLKAPIANAAMTGSFSLGQIELLPHATVTNFVMDPTLGAVQLINATNWVVRFLHATNIAAGKQASFLVLAGTNATVSVEIPTTGLEWTNKVSIAAGQALQVSMYGYGSNPTNVVLTMGRMLQ